MALRLALLVACAFTLAGCPSPPTVEPRDAGRLPDGAPIDAWRGTTPTLGPCTENAVCADAPGVACLTNIPGGACTRRCTSDGECGVNGSCVSNVCLWRCSSGTGECVAHAGACLTPMGSSAWCVPICYPESRRPAGYPSCMAGLECDPYTGTCESTPAPGSPNGAPCSDAIECRGGECWLETDFTTNEPTGFIDGLCASYGVVPPGSDYEGAHLPQGSCPDGSAVMPGYAPFLSGDLAVCMTTCLDDSGCRTGYACTHMETGTRYVEGLCLPIDCTSAPCPPGTTCQTTTNPWFGHPVCGRNS